jgi:hypothetical protein
MVDRGVEAAEIAGVFGGGGDAGEQGSSVVLTVAW